MLDAAALAAGSLAVVIEWTNMRIRRVVPDITTDDLIASRAFYGDLLGFDRGMRDNVAAPT